MPSIPYTVPNKCLNENFPRTDEEMVAVNLVSGKVRTHAQMKILNT